MPAADNEDPRFQEHMKWLGHVAAISASLDLSVNMTIWELANVERWIGACLTTQIFSPSSRFRVLISLVHVRGGKPEIIRALSALDLRRLPWMNSSVFTMTFKTVFGA